MRNFIMYLLWRLGNFYINLQPRDYSKYGILYVVCDHIKINSNYSIKMKIKQKLIYKSKWKGK